ncbi:MAG: protease modulator HflC [Verrucomicrobia bacterium]|nr:protease modulator HflC [Verrucomicrobiota bacterium]
MKRNTVTLVIGGLLILIFFVLLFTFQVRQTEVAVITTFGRPGAPIREPGLYFKWPRPIQRVHKLDKRIHSFDSRLEQVLTKGGDPLMVMLYVGWQIKDPETFFASSRGGTVAEAEQKLGGLVESSKNQVVGNHPFSHFVSTDANELKFEEIEKEILEKVRPDAEAKYGIEVQFIGIKKLSLPESVTEKVFARMQAERDKVIQTLKSEGERSATIIRSDADRDAAKIRADAEAKATALRSEADAEASKWLAVFSQNPELAVFLSKIKSLPEVLKEKSTLILDQRNPLLELLGPLPKPAAAQPGRITLGGDDSTNK